jgi:cell wall-associated NlpC family hydrolase
MNSLTPLPPMDPSTTLTAAQRENLNRLVGIPFVKNGVDASRDGGLDCYGVVRAAAVVFGVMLPADSAACFALTPAAFSRVEPAANDWREGDVIVLDRSPQHMGIVVEIGGGGSFAGVLHALRGGKSAIMNVETFLGLAKRWAKYRKSA